MGADRIGQRYKERNEVSNCPNFPKRVMTNYIVSTFVVEMAIPP